MLEGSTQALEKLISEVGLAMVSWGEDKQRALKECLAGGETEVARTICREGSREDTVSFM